MYAGNRVGIFMFVVLMYLAIVLTYSSMNVSNCMREPCLRFRCIGI